MDVDARAEREKAFVAERSVAFIRVLIIAFNSIVFHVLMASTAERPAFAYVIIVAANAYGLGVWLFQPYRRFPVMMSSYFTSLFDALFISVWIFATGGASSPFHPLWLVSVTAIAFRYGIRETFVAAALYAIAYVALLGALGQLRDNVLTVVVRVGYIFFVAAIGGLLARESSAQVREKLETRALADSLRESEDRLRRLADATFEGIAFVDDGVVLESNHAFARMFGYAPGETAGRRVVDLVTTSDRGRVLTQLASAADAPFESVGVRADGSPFDIEIAGRDIPYRGRPARVMAVRDVSHRRRAERLEELDRMKTQFINNAAHELSTPLTPIKLQAHLLGAGALGPLDERQARAVAVIARNADQLGHVVKDVLDSARIQAGRVGVVRAPMDLATLARDAVDSFADLATLEGVALRLDAPASLGVEGDRARLAQVVYNLLANALKFTPQGGEVVVRVRALGDEAVVDVADTGAGLRPEDLPHLFQAFSQLHDETGTAKGGTGLGLYISKGIVDAHGGRIWAASDGPGRGATFSFALPR